MALNPNSPNAADTLHTHAITAEQHLEKLATGLGQLGADPQAVKAVGAMADTVRKIAVTLAKGGTQEQAPPREQPQTMDSAADAMMAEHRAQRGG